MRTLLCLSTLASALLVGASDLRANEATQVVVGSANVAVNPDQWRYRYHNNQWWYYTPGNYWMTHSNGNWNRYYAPGAGVNAGVNLGNRYNTYYGNSYNRGYYGNGYYNNGYYNNGYYGNNYRGYNNYYRGYNNGYGYGNGGVRLNAGRGIGVYIR
jgi:hypothetical protein